MPSPTVYLAGPAVFEPDPAPTFAAMKAICARHALQGLSPMDNQLALSGPPGPALARQIVGADIALMQAADAGVFCLDGFRRGPEMDPGTAFEVGYMHALGKPLAGWTSNPDDYPTRVRTYFQQTYGLPLVATPGRTAQSGSLRDPDGILVHSEGCLQNAMVHAGIELAGGHVAAHPDWLTAFGSAIAQLAAALARGTDPGA